MARYTGPKTKKARALGEPIFGPDKYFERKKHPPGQHGNARRRKQASNYKLQLMEKQKAKYTYGVLERQFRNMFKSAQRKSGITGTILLQMLESRLDNVVFRMGIAPTRNAARQLVTHKHIVLNGIVNNVPSAHIRPGDVIGVRGKSQGLLVVRDCVGSRDIRKFGWMEFSPDKMEGKFLEYPDRDMIPENVNEQLIVELYSK